MGYTNSSLVTYTNTNHSHYSDTRVNITRITVHCWVGQVTAQTGCDYFASTNRLVSSNYIVGKDGSIGLCVPERYRSWCTSSAYNDNRAITIECASDSTPPYAFTSACYNSLVRLVADICARNNIVLTYISPNVSDRNNQTLTMHCQYDNKDCPGGWFKARASAFCREVNDLVATGQYSGSGGDYSDETDTSEDFNDDNRDVPGNIIAVLKRKNKDFFTGADVKKVIFRVRSKVKDRSSQKGAFTSLEYAKKCAEKNYGCSVYNSFGERVYTPEVYYKTYKVKKNDTLWGIAAKNLGDGMRYKDIIKLNGLTKEVIYVNQILKIPVEE